MRSLESKIAPAPQPMRRRRDDDDDAATLPAEGHQAPHDAAVVDVDAAATADEGTGHWTVAAAADAPGSRSSGTVPDGTASGGGALAHPPSLPEAGVGLGIVGLIGAVAVGTSTRTPATPSPKPVLPGTATVPGTSIPPAAITPPDQTVTPDKPVDPTTSVTPGEPVDPATSVTPDKPIDPTTSVTPDKPIDPTTSVTPDKPVDPTTSVTPDKPIDPTTSVTPDKPVDPTTSVTPGKPVDPLPPQTPDKPVAPQAASFAISDAHVIEATAGERELVFLVQRSGDRRQPGSVRYAIQADQSTLATDELVGDQAGLVFFKPGESQQLIRLKLKGDYLREVDEQLSVTLSEPDGGTLARANGIGTIHEVDVTRLQAAYGMRDLNAKLEGSAIRVRRSSDDTEMDIGFNADGQLDREALLNFVGRAAEDKGYVKIWYDQSGHSRHMTAQAADQQGVIVDGGKVVTRADGSVAISFNAGRNGEADDGMTTAGAGGKDWKSVAVYANVQSEGAENGTLFNLGDGSTGRLSVHYPADGKVSFDVLNFTNFPRLNWTPTGDDDFVEAPNNLVFEAHSDNPGAGTLALNRIDAQQAIFVGGQWVASGDKVASVFRTSDTWRLAHHESKEGGNLSYLQQAMYNEFLVYLAKGNSTPSLRNLIGSAQDDVLTFSGEQDLKRIDGLAGHDTLYVSGKTDLDLAQFKQGIRDVEQLWLENGHENTLRVTGATLSAMAEKMVTIRLDASDRVEIDRVAVPLDSLEARLNQLNPAMQFHVIVGAEAVI